MRRIKIVFLALSVIVFSLAMASCGLLPDATGETETEAMADTSPDNDWLPDETPPYSYARELRDRLDPLLEDKFGITEVRYKVSDILKVYDEYAYYVSYTLENVPEGEAFYYDLDEVFGQVFDLHLFVDMESAESYFNHYDEIPPEHMSVAMNYEGNGYAWEVTFDGITLSFFIF